MDGTGLGVAAMGILMSREAATDLSASGKNVWLQVVIFSHLLQCCNTFACLNRSLDHYHQVWHRRLWSEISWDIKFKIWKNMKDQGLVKGRAPSARPQNPQRCLCSSFNDASTTFCCAAVMFGAFPMRIHTPACSSWWILVNAAAAGKQINKHGNAHQRTSYWYLLMLLDLSSLDLQHLVQDTLTPRYHHALSHFALHSLTHVHDTHVPKPPWSVCPTTSEWQQMASKNLPWWCEPANMAYMALSEIKSPKIQQFIIVYICLYSWFSSCFLLNLS